ncbi:7231_t:CDS:2 [Rhizophagus irregularis]|nr:7231_t:CDS:2 [Rhizophagus irregularis]
MKKNGKKVIEKVEKDKGQKIRKEEELKIQSLKLPNLIIERKEGNDIEETEKTLEHSKLQLTLEEVVDTVNNTSCEIVKVIKEYRETDKPECQTNVEVEQNRKSCVNNVGSHDNGNKRNNRVNVFGGQHRGSREEE